MPTISPCDCLGKRYQGDSSLEQDYRSRYRGALRDQWRYVNGEGVSQNYAEAVKWYRQVVGQGFPEAQAELGVMYGFGRGVPQDHVLVIRLYGLRRGRGS